MAERASQEYRDTVDRVRLQEVAVEDEAYATKENVLASHGARDVLQLIKQ